MKHILTILAALLLYGQADAQSVITSWWRNANGKTSSYWYRSGSSGPFTLTATSDSADCVKVLYSKDSVWIYSHGMTDRMGAYSNPGACSTQSYVHRFPRVPVVSGTKSISPKGGQIGLLLNGIPIYGLGDGKSWNGTTNANGGQSVWNDEVYLGEGVSLDTAFTAHPQQQGAYHSHALPKRLYETYSSSVHSPIVGWAFDGYPVYGPYGYSTAMSSSSAVARMKSGYSLRNITTRTTLPTIPNGGGTASQTGPAVSGTYPLGIYVEDYEWLSSNGGDLDQYNGPFLRNTGISIRHLRVLRHNDVRRRAAVSVLYRAVLLRHACYGRLSGARPALYQRLPAGNRLRALCVLRRNHPSR